MKQLLVFVFALFSLPLLGQFIYLKADSEFVVLNSNSTQAFSSVWMKMSDSSELAHIVLKSGKTLKRDFKKGIENPYFVVVNNRVRYRPNLNVENSDTIIITPIIDKEVTKPKDTTAIDDFEIVEYSHFQTVLNTVNQTAYEFEKTQLLMSEISRSHFSCDELQQLLTAIKYDASRVEVINSASSKIKKDCLVKLKQMVKESYQDQILIK